MAKPRHRRWDFVTRGAPCPQERAHRQGPEGNDDSQVLQEHHLALQVWLAPSELDSRWLVVRRRAPHRSRDVAIPKDESIVFRDRCRLVRKSRSVESAIQPFSAAISGEGASRAVASVGRGSQADDEDPRVRVPESRDRPTPVIPIAEGGAFRAGDLLAVSHEPRTLATCDNLGRHPFEAIRRHLATAFHPVAKSVRPMENG